jgi:hypothetical protein
VSKETYDSWSRATAFALKLIGILGIIFVPVFWALTGRIELAFLPFFGTMAGVGLGMDTLREINTARTPPQGRGESAQHEA